MLLCSKGLSPCVSHSFAVFLGENDHVLLPDSKVVVLLWDLGGVQGPGYGFAVCGPVCSRAGTLSHVY